ncbi:glycoside hydrolase family 32 protein [Chitinophaga sp. 212800010-3]|uniref:glycoside hydrolase family 32 protein n=1 Tax=unclassified Chitinophaga TaxID=2619133 RepID=UPI002E10780E
MKRNMYITYKHLWCVCLILTLFACKKNDTATALTPDAISGKPVYPVPPSMWMQPAGAQPYYSSGFVGDPMPFYDNGAYHIFYLHDGDWASYGFHPIHAFETNDFSGYQYDGRVMPFGNANQPDTRIGTGSVIKAGDKYYMYYTYSDEGNWSFGKSRECIMYATSTDLKTWTKHYGYTIYSPDGFTDRYNFRDAEVIYNKEANEYMMLVASRLNDKAVITKYTTTDPAADNWAYKGLFYTADVDNYVMMECPDVFKFGNYWYLVFSENGDHPMVHYRYSSSVNGPWTKPANDLLDGSYFYAGKTAGNETTRYLSGWVPRNADNNDNGSRLWGGNLVSHQLSQNSDGTLNVKLPAGTEARFTNPVTPDAVFKDATIQQDQQRIAFQTAATPSYIVFDQISGKKMITATISGVDVNAQFGFVFGMDKSFQKGNYYLLDFNQAQHSISSTYMNGGMPRTNAAINYTLGAGKEYQLKVVTDGSVCTMYIDDKAALTSRIYSLANSFWGFYAANGNIQIKNLKLYQIN